MCNTNADLFPFTVYYVDRDDQSQLPLIFDCWAEDECHAQNYCTQSHPGCHLLYTEMTYHNILTEP